MRDDCQDFGIASGSGEQTMETQTTTTSTRPKAPIAAAEAGVELVATAPGGIRVIRRNGKLTNFDPGKIQIAMTKAFLAVEGGSAAASARVRETVEALSAQVVSALTRHLNGGGTLHIEDIQDQVELALMRNGEHKIARSYVLYREERTRERAAEQAAKLTTTAAPAQPDIRIKFDDGSLRPLNEERLHRVCAEACNGLTGVDSEEIV